MDASFQVSPSAQEIIDAVREVLGAAVALRDTERRSFHLAMSGWWFSHPYEPDDVPGDRYRVEARVNDRWILQAAGKGALRAGAQEMVTWAALSLRPHLDGPTVPDDVAAAEDDDGGTSGPAEIGIPSWWARKLRN